MNNRTIRIVLLIVVAGALGLLIYNKVKKDKSKATGAKMAANASKQKLLVDAFVVKPVRLKNNIDAAGSLLSNESLSIQPETTGRITGIFFKEGTHVSKGDLLVKLFDGDLQAQLEKLKLQKALASQMLERQKNLLSVNGISQQDVDNTQNQVASVQADIDYNQAEIQKTEIRAPFSGIVGLRSVSEGAIVSPTTVIANLEQTTPIKLDFSIPEKYRSEIKKGDPITFTVAELPDETFDGRIYAIDPAIDLATRSIHIRALSENKSGRLSPGSFANIHIEFREIPDALMIPTQSLVPTTRDPQVVVIKNGKAEFVDVQTGLRNSDQVQITHGLHAGDTIITAGTMQSKPGLPVQISHLDNNQ